MWMSPPVVCPAAHPGAKTGNPVWGTMNKATMKIPGWVFLHTKAFILQKHLGRVDLLGHSVSECFARNNAAFSQNGSASLHCHEQCVRVAGAPHLADFWCCPSFNRGRAGECAVVSPGGFHLHGCTTEGASFPVLLPDACYNSFEMPVRKPFVLLKIGSFVFFFFMGDS